MGIGDGSQDTTHGACPARHQIADRVLIWRGVFVLIIFLFIQCHRWRFFNRLLLYRIDVGDPLIKRGGLRSHSPLHILVHDPSLELNVQRHMLWSLICALSCRHY